MSMFVIMPDKAAFTRLWIETMEVNGLKRSMSAYLKVCSDYSPDHTVAIYDEDTKETHFFKRALDDGNIRNVIVDDLDRIREG